MKRFFTNFWQKRLQILRTIAGVTQVQEESQRIGSTVDDIRRETSEIRDAIDALGRENEALRSMVRTVIKLVQQELVTIDSLMDNSQDSPGRQVGHRPLSISPPCPRALTNMFVNMIRALEPLFIENPAACAAFAGQLISEGPLVLNRGIVQRMQPPDQVATLKLYFQDSTYEYRYRIAELVLKRSAIAKTMDALRFPSQEVPLGGEARPEHQHENGDTVLPSPRAEIGRIASCRLLWGDHITVVTADLVGQLLMRQGFFEPGLTQFILLNLDQAAIFFDVGAHFGYYSLLAAHLLNSTGQIHAFEPSSRTFEVLRENCQRAGDIHVNNVAVWSETSEVAFTELGDGYAAWNSILSPRQLPASNQEVTVTTRKVPVISLDDYCHESGIFPDFVKIDAESAEGAILDGMKGILTNKRPIVTLEVGDLDVPGAPSSRELAETMLNFGYEVFECREGKIMPHQLLDKYEYDNLFFLPHIS